MSAPRLAFAAAMTLLLSGCASPQKIKKTEQDAARYRVEESEKAAYDQCTEQALPGTLQHFACRMSAEKGTGSAPAK